MRLILLCHGATAATHAAAFPAGDEPLEPAALARTRALAASLPNRAAICCSPALAARQTAEVFGVAAERVTGLCDWQAGRWAGRTLAELHLQEPEALAAWRNDPAAAPHGGESLLDLIARVGGWLDSLRGHDRTLLAITHAAVIRAAISYALAAPPASFWRIDVAPLSQALLHGSGGRWSLRLSGLAVGASGAQRSPIDLLDPEQ